jgi:hypothetical protein
VDTITPSSLVDLKISKVMDARKQPATQKCVEPRRRVPPRDVHSLPTTAIVLPFDGDSMSGIFRASAKEVWQKPRPNLLEPNEANPGNSVTPDG